MNKDYSQIFCIIGSRGKFCESYQDYLPPIDPYYLDKKFLQPNEVTTKDSIYNNIYIYRDLVKRGEFLFWQSKLIDHLTKAKKPKKQRLDLT